MKNIFRKIISFSLIVALLFENNSLNVLAAGNKAEKSQTMDIDEQISVDKPSIIQEITENRGEYTKEYLLSDNSRTLMVYADKVHYETEDGSLAEIDNTLIDTEEGFENKANSYQLIITDNEESQGEVKYKEDQYEIDWQMVSTESDSSRIEAGLTNADVEVNIEDISDSSDDNITDEEVYNIPQSAVTIRGYDKGVEVEYIPTGNGVKENIILPSRKCSPSYTFKVNLEGLNARLSVNNEVEFYDAATDEVVYYFPAPFMVDNKGEISYDASYVLSSVSENAVHGKNKIKTDKFEAINSDELYLTIELDKQWLKKASYPVTVDPVLKQARTKNLIDYGSIDSKGNVYDTLYVGNNSGASYKSYVRFDLPQLRQQCVVSEALLYLNGSGSTSRYLLSNMVDSQWYNKVANQGGTKLSWANQPQEGVLLDYAINGGYFNITRAVTKWYEGTHENYGVEIKAKTNTQAKETVKLKDVANSPYLKITYSTFVGTENYWGTHSTYAGTAGSGEINDFTGALTIKNTDVTTSGLRMPMTIAHVYNSNLKESERWQLNYNQTIKVPVDVLDVKEYPYVYTDEDGTEHYFKKSSVTYLQNGISKVTAGTTVQPAAKDEDGLGLFIVPVTDSSLKDKYPVKLVDKSASIVKYFDHFGNLGMITDSNLYEDGSNNKSTDHKEQNRIVVSYEKYRSALPTSAINKAVDTAQAFYNVCCISGMKVSDSRYKDALENVKNDIEAVKIDIYAKSDYTMASSVDKAMTSLSNLTDVTTDPTITTAKSKAKEILTNLQSAKNRADTLKEYEPVRITSVKDAVDNTAYFSYDSSGRIVSISDPSRSNKNNTYEYDSNGNLTVIRFANDKYARYYYDANKLLVKQQDNDGYSIEYTYNQNSKRVVGIQEKHNSTQGQTVGIQYNEDHTTEYRFSGVDDVYGNADDIINTYVFDEKGRTLCVYSKRANENKVIGASACTYETETESNTDVRNKIKDTAVVGMNTQNYLKNHSFEYNDTTWKSYKGASETTPESGAVNIHSTSKKYTGAYGAYFDMSKRKSGGIAGVKQEVYLKAGTYTFSGYCMTGGIANIEAYLKVVDSKGNTYYSDKINEDTPVTFNDGWKRPYVTFTLSENAKIKVYAETNCLTQSGTGFVAFDSIQMETGSVCNDYNLLEDGSFEITEGTVPYNWTNMDSNVEVRDERASGGVDGQYCYHITGQPGKDKYLKLSTNLGVDKTSYMLTGWYKTDTTPIRDGRDCKVHVVHAENITTDAGVQTVIYQAQTNLNAYSQGWKYFCLIMPAASWKNTTITFRFYDNIGNLYLDGLQLVKNDVQTRKYNANGKLTSREDNVASKTYSYDAYNRPHIMTTAGGAQLSYTYAGNNDNTRIAASIGPDVNLTYDAYGNMLTSSTKDPDGVNGQELYTKNTYTGNGNYLRSVTDNRGYETSYTYDEMTGQKTSMSMPQRAGTTPLTVRYNYDTSKKERLKSIEENGRYVGYEYGEFDDLTGVEHNGFKYNYSYDVFGNLLSTSIAGTVMSTNTYAPNNGSLIKTTYADNTTTSSDYDSYGRVVRNYLNNTVTDCYEYDNDGNVKKHTDNLNNIITEYDYNNSNKVVRSRVYNGSVASGNLESETQYSFAKNGKIDNLSYRGTDGAQKTYVYTYAKDDLSTKDIYPDNSYTTYSYDTLRRENKRIYSPKSNATDAKKLYSELEYVNTTVTEGTKTRNATTTLVSKYTNKLGSTGKAQDSYTYTYDEWGNISSITYLNGKVERFTYNDIGELIKVSTTLSGKTTEENYSYDLGGNITSSTDSSGIRHTYVYDNVWKDKLVSYDGKAITYDVFGNPTNYMGSAMQWDVHGRLTNISNAKNARNVQYTYLSDGLRYKKIVDGKTTRYTYNNGLLLSQTTDNETINFYYDSEGNVVELGLKKNNDGERFYFLSRNNQGDVTGIYRGADSVLIGTYEYDTWGNIKSVKEASSGIDTDNILIKNPFRYRSYMYDNETGFYYLKARLYDSTVKRFISADTIIMNVGERAIGYNLYQYAYNNPVNYSDSTGHMPELTRGQKLVIGAMIAIVFIGTFIGTGGLGALAFAMAGGGAASVGSSLAAATLVSAGYGACCVAISDITNAATTIMTIGKEKETTKDNIDSSDYMEQLDNFSEDRIKHIVNGSKKTNHGWEKLVPDKNWNDIKNIINMVMINGVEETYKSVFSKNMTIDGHEVVVTYNKILDFITKISDAWVKP